MLLILINNIMYNPFKKERPSIKEHIRKCLKKECSDREIVNRFEKYLSGDFSCKSDVASSIKKIIRAMRLKGDIIEVKREEHKCKNAENFISNTIFYKLK